MSAKYFQLLRVHILNEFRLTEEKHALKPVLVTYNS